MSKKRAEAAARSVFEHVTPPPIGVDRNAHVIGHDVEQEAHAARAHLTRQHAKAFFAPSSGLICSCATTS